MKFCEFEKIAQMIPVLAETEVLVIGGGPAGIAAAAASARRKDVKTLLVEKEQFLGGALADERGIPVTGAFPGNVSLGGVMDEILAKLRFAGTDSAVMADLEQKGVVYYHEPEYAKLLADDILKKSGCQVMTDAAAADVIERDGKVVGVLVASHMKLGVIWTDVAVDCTGDGEMAARLLCPMQEKISQKRSYPYSLANVDFDAVSDYLKEDPHMKAALEKAAKEQNAPEEADCVWRLQGDVRAGVVYGDTIRVEGPDSEQAARRKLWSHIGFFRRYIPGMERCTLLRASGQTMPLETRRIQGEKVYTFQGTQERLSRRDGIVRISTGRDSWEEFPYDVLVPRGISNLLAAGKTVSVDQEVQRAMGLGTLLVLGQAAGAAAAIMAAKKITNRQVDGGFMKSLMEELGCDITGDKTRKYYGDKKASDWGM